ncbi:hypothetical protein F0562_015553 [Nyssa sinensis]|uniref:Uncharacterized protein n=1 Tax=Nyssa sinensis TaxID=561372 RepID=A0A5J4ZJ56_9ASTE|nr:hypothetical protein F0562_015553 [Nyssa sinensis]
MGELHQRVGPAKGSTYGRTIDVDELYWTGFDDVDVVIDVDDNSHFNFSDFDDEEWKCNSDELGTTNNNEDIRDEVNDTFMDVEDGHISYYKFDDGHGQYSSNNDGKTRLVDRSVLKDFSIQ